MLTVAIFIYKSNWSQGLERIRMWNDFQSAKQDMKWPLCGLMSLSALFQQPDTMQTWKDPRDSHPAPSPQPHMQTFPNDPP